MIFAAIPSMAVFAFAEEPSIGDRYNDLKAKIDEINVISGGVYSPYTAETNSNGYSFEAGSYVITGVSNDGSSSTGVFENSTNSLGTNGEIYAPFSSSVPASDSDSWTFTAYNNGYRIYYDTRYLRVSNSSLSTTTSSYNRTTFTVSVNEFNSTVTIYGGSRYLYYSSSNSVALTSSASSATDFVLYNTDGSRWVAEVTPPVADGTYIIRSADTLMTGSAAATTDYTSQDNNIVTSSENEFTFENTRSNLYYISNLQGQYLNISSSGEISFSKTAQEISVKEQDGSVYIYVQANTAASQMVFLGNNGNFSNSSTAASGNSAYLLNLYEKTGEVESEDISDEKLMLAEALKRGITANPAIYTEETYITLLQYLEAGYALFMNESAVNAAVVEAADAINEAFAALQMGNFHNVLESQINELVLSGSTAKMELYEALHEGIAVDFTIYTYDTLTNLILALQYGLEVYNSDASTDSQYTAASTDIRNALAELSVSIQTFPAALYKYGYNINGTDDVAKYGPGGAGFNSISTNAMAELIIDTPELRTQIEELIRSAVGSNAVTESNISIVANAYANIYSLHFYGRPVGGQAELSGIITTFWNNYWKPETDGDGASVQGLFSTTLGEDGLPGSHDAYPNELEYINTNVTKPNTWSGITDYRTVTVNNTTVTLTPLSGISVYAGDYFSKTDVDVNSDDTYDKYYWNVDFPFVASTNEFGVSTYIYDSYDTDRVFQASYDDASHTATAQLTSTETAGQGGVSGPNTQVDGKGIGFFPFNNRLDGDNADMAATENAIYHFGMSFSTNFFIPQGGTYTDGEDIVFNFSGDDDVLVYIDDVLVLDNGGLHGAKSASINFTDMSVTYQYIAETETNTVVNPGAEGITYKYGETYDYISEQNLAALEYLYKIANDEEIHTFSFYYLERGSSDSNCKITFNIQKLSDYLRLNDDTVVLDYGLPVAFNTTENNVFFDYENMPNYEYIGITEKLPESASMGIMFVAPDEDEIIRFDSSTDNNKLEHQGMYGKFTVFDNGEVEYVPQTMTFSDTDSFYICSRVALDRTYPIGTIYYAFERVTVLPATTVYYEQDFVAFSDGFVAQNTENPNLHGLWQDVESIVPDGITIGEIYQNTDYESDPDANNYGYDAAYDDCSEFSGYTAKYVTVSAENNPNASYSGGSGAKWPVAEFEFNGTGFDIISVTSKDTGTINVTVRDSDGKTVKNHTVNTYYGYSYGQLYSDENGNPTLVDTGVPLYFTADRSYTTEITYYDKNGAIITENAGELEPAFAIGWIVDSNISADNSLYQIPVIKVKDLEYGTYSVTVTPMYSSRMDMMRDGAYEFYLDAVRVYNPAGKGETLTNSTISYAYTYDKESNPDYLELRNMLIGSNQLTNDDSSAKGAVFIDGISNNKDVSNYTAGGPNNELYLSKGQAVAFEIWASAIPDDVQIGAKAVGKSQPTMMISYELGSNTYTSSLSIGTATDLYYSIDGLLREDSLGQLNWTSVTGSDGKNYYTSGTIVIQNTTDGIISITNLKWTFPSAGIGYYENISDNGIATAAEDVMLMSTFSTLTMARSSLKMVNADLDIPQDNITVENNSVSAGEAIVVKVSTSTDVDSLIIKDEKGKVITPDAVESYVETIDNKEVKQWSVTLSENEAGTYIYTITGVYENGYVDDSVPAVINVTVNANEIENETIQEEPAFFEKLVGFIEQIIDFFKELIEILTGT